MMPDYNQFSIGSCAVGCGPVAWAQVFGYFDRRGHEPRGNMGSRQLYRCGSDGTTGNDTCEAPPKMAGDIRIQNYIKKMAQILGTFCLFDQGATWQSSMDKVANFFKERQGSDANIQLHTNGLFSLVGVYSDDIRDKALTYLRQKWPVIVGIRVSGIFSQHYPVMTMYRQTTTSTKTCTQGTSSCTVKDTTEYEMYLHMGWGGDQNGWRKAEMFMAAAARY
ncbi:uncharacterized protein LOC112571364 [Pomacea canaliculata]|uniref:uncharacterized protein LOC112571364 n=1 Tax=Pomacea canaliculata TaxID=400727 RepID=UPI000D739560|nr:uncharacterized protein LOC112571364 [Pomacea canaliculata]